jgi:hypothetical protein
MANNFLPQVDYTSRDYQSIKNDLIALIPTYAPEWTNRDPADFGITLIELFSYMGDLLNFYIDRSANEAYISTASQRANVLKIAKLLAYSPTESTASTVTLTFQNSTASAITVPVLTKVTTSTNASASSTQIVFETNASVIVPAKIGSTNGSATVKATQGQTITSENVGTSDGTSNQSFQLTNFPVINESVSVIVNGVTYSRAQYLIDYNDFDAAFTTETDADGLTYIVFGDNVSGRIPPSNSTIYVTYRIGGGTIGNTATGTIKYILTNAVAGLTVNNQDIDTAGDGAATGGSDPESTDSIRTNVSKSVRSLNRAVSISDYARLCLQVNGIAKTSADADVYSSVVIYFAPFGDAGVEADNVTPTAVFTALTLTALEFFVDKIPANTTITFQPPSYVKVNSIVDITVNPKYNQSLVKSDVTTALVSLLAFDNVVFNDTITVKDLYSAITSVDGVTKANVLSLSRDENEQMFAINNKRLTSNVATLDTSSTHNLTVGQTVLISGVDSTFNGSFIVSSVSSSSFSYALTAPNVISVAVSPVGIATALRLDEINCEINEIPKLGTLTINAFGGITN